VRANQRIEDRKSRPQRDLRVVHVFYNTDQRFEDTTLSTPVIGGRCSDALTG